MIDLQTRPTSPVVRTVGRLEDLPTEPVPWPGDLEASAQPNVRIGTYALVDGRVFGGQAHGRWVHLHTQDGESAPDDSWVPDHKDRSRFVTTVPHSVPSLVFTVDSSARLRGNPGRARIVMVDELEGTAYITYEAHEEYERSQTATIAEREAHGPHPNLTLEGADPRPSRWSGEVPLADLSDFREEAATQVLIDSEGVRGHRVFEGFPAQARPSWTPTMTCDAQRVLRRIAGWRWRARCRAQDHAKVARLTDPTSGPRVFFSASEDVVRHRSGGRGFDALRVFAISDSLATFRDSRAMPSSRQWALVAQRMALVVRGNPVATWSRDDTGNDPDSAVGDSDALCDAQSDPDFCAMVRTAGEEWRVIHRGAGLDVIDAALELSAKTPESVLLARIVRRERVGH